MPKGINKVILVGNLGNDPEMRQTAGGAAVATVSIATSDTWQDKTTGEKQERTEWHRVVFFNRLAEIVGQYLRKGRQIYVEGRLQTRKWQDQAGQDRYTTEIIASEMQILGNRGGGDDAGHGTEGGYSPATTASATAYKSASGGGTKAQPVYAPTAPEFDDDIPF